MSLRSAITPPGLSTEQLFGVKRVLDCGGVVDAEDHRTAEGVGAVADGFLKDSVYPEPVRPGGQASERLASPPGPPTPPLPPPTEHSCPIPPTSSTLTASGWRSTAGWPAAKTNSGCGSLPLHLAMEGYLALQFGGPTIAWQEWTRPAVNSGLSPRAEDSYTATALHTDRQGLVLRLDRAGFGHLLRPEIIDACRNRARQMSNQSTKA